MRRVHGIIACLAALAAGQAMLSARAGDRWPQFRGPDGQGHAADAQGLPIRWGEGENIAWKSAIAGRGHSSPVVLDGQIWLTTADEVGRDLRAVCLDLESGETIHDAAVFQVDDPPQINAKNSYASPTPAIEPGRVYVHFGALGTACVSTDTGEVLWRNRQLVIDHKEGPGSSPVLVGDLLIVHCDGIDSQYVVALVKASGEIAWKRNRSGAKDPNPDFRKAYSTPLVVDVAGKRQLVSTGADRASGLDPRTGEELWHVDYKGFSNVPCPVAGHGLVFLCTGFMKPQLWAVRPGGRGNVTSTHVAWQHVQQVPANPSPILVGDEIYMVSDQGVATCLDAHSGEVLWQKRMGGNYSASPVYADGQIYFSSEEGVTSVIRPDRQKCDLIGVNALEGPIMASPAIVDDAILLRTGSHLYRIEAPAEAASQ